MHNLLLSSILSSLTSFPCAAATAAVALLAPVMAAETASTRISTPENQRWFSDLIALNPTATVVVVGQGIAVSRTGGLVLPAGPVPGNVTLN